VEVDGNTLVHDNSALSALVTSWSGAGEEVQMDFWRLDIGSTFASQSFGNRVEARGLRLRRVVETDFRPSCAEATEKPTGQRCSLSNEAR